MNLEGVEKTMLLTLFAKAKHSQQKNLEPPHPIEDGDS